MHQEPLEGTTPPFNPYCLTTIGRGYGASPTTAASCAVAGMANPHDTHIGRTKRLNESGYWATLATIIKTLYWSMGPYKRDTGEIITVRQTAIRVLGIG